LSLAVAVAVVDMQVEAVLADMLSEPIYPLLRDHPTLLMSALAAPVAVMVFLAQQETTVLFRAQQLLKVAAVVGQAQQAKLGVLAAALVLALIQAALLRHLVKETMAVRALRLPA
jgi:hypothetical protein